MPLNEDIIKFISRKYLILISFCLIAFVSIFMFFSRSHDVVERLKIVETEIAMRSGIQHEVNLIGTIRPKHFCVLTAKAKGTIDTLIPAGSSLKKEDVIAKIENPDVEKAYDLSVLAEQIASSQYERSNTLFKKGGTSRESLETKQQHLIESQKNLTKASIERDNTFVKAPFDGVLGSYKIKDGEQVSEDLPLASFYNGSELLIEFDIPGQYIQKIKVGQPVSINGKSLKLTHVQRAIDEESHMCPAYVEIRNDDNLVIGSSINIILITEEKNNTIVIPYSAVFIKNNKNWVYVVKEGKVVLREIELGIKNKEKIEILNGIQEKEEIVIIGQDRLYEEMPVKIATKEKQT